MKKYFIDSLITYCYPHEVSKATEDYGVLSQYIGKFFNRNEIDEIICEMITKHPYIEHAMWLKIYVMWEDENTTGFYHVLNFTNDNDEKQNKRSLEIKYEK